MISSGTIMREGRVPVYMHGIIDLTYPEKQ